ncbi:MAG: hypothetical protein KGL53_11505, partial [Elusimicrobia bacterium]|nr:hypothetical protein [Elusimicrobiota bacterium]
APGAGAAVETPSSPESRLKMGRAVSAYYALKNSARFKDSPVVKAWTKDFLSHPDLKALNDQWRKDHDPLRFLVGMVRSPNFQAMAKTYLAQADMRAFIKDMASSPAVLSSAGTFMSDDKVKGAVTALNLLPGGGAAPMPDSSAQLGRVKADPSLKATLEGAAPAPSVQ